MRLSFVVTLVTLAACGPGDLEPTELCGEEPFAPTAPPEVAKVTSSLGAPGGFRIAIVSEGYTQSELRGFEDSAQSYIDAMRADRGSIVGRRPGLFTFHELSVPSRTHWVRNADPNDTAFGSCLVRDPSGLSGAFLSADLQMARDVVAARVGPVDVVVLLQSTTIGRPNASSTAQFAAPGVPPVVLLTRADWHTLDHELGHALIGLEDEYSETSDPLPADRLPFRSAPEAFFMIPNVTDDPAGTKWRHLVSGAVPGGMRYASGIFHPTTSCRMQRNELDFCPVCSDAIDRLLDAKERSVDTDGVPRCGLLVRKESEDQLTIFGQAYDLTPPVSATVTLEDGTTYTNTTERTLATTGMTITRQGLTRTASLRCTDGRGLHALTTMTLNY